MLKNIKRPKAGETEDDLLEFQRQFLAGQESASASVVKRPGDKRKPGAAEAKDEPMQSTTTKDIVQMNELPAKLPESAPPVKKSRFRAAQEKATVKDDQHSEDPLQLMEKHDRHMEAVLAKIIERDTRNTDVQLPRQTHQAFPTVPYRGTLEQTKQPSKKKSLFAQQFSQKSAEDFGVVMEQEQQKLRQEIASTKQSEEMDTGEEKSGTSIIEGTGLSATFGRSEARRIHEENLSKMADMSEEEIVAEQRKLLEMLDPKLVQFLKDKKKSRTDESDVDMESADTHVDKETSSKKKKHFQKEKPEIPVEVKGDWIHMDKIEYDKLEWMKDLPAPAAGDTETGQQARFDFQGNLMPAETDVPVNIGLHHHGDEPERAGYTLEELFHLSRSTNIQQRTLALHTLARIIHKAKEGQLEFLIQSPILPSILDAGVVFLLRWALDDRVDSVIAAAVAALNAALVNQADELSIDRVLPWHQGQCITAQAVCEEEQSQLPGADEKPDETDADVAKRDLILGLVTRMVLLPRLRYILQTTRPQAPTVIHILEILIRIARHSAKVAYEVFRCQGLLDEIVKHFLPLSWKVNNTSQPPSGLYGVPVPAAMKLIRTLAQAGKNMASLLLSKYDLKARLLQYLVQADPVTLQLPESEAYNLQIESYYTWRTCLLFGLADDLFIELYPVIVSELQTSCRLCVEQNQSTLHVKRLTAMICAIEAAVCVTAVAHSKPKFGRSEDISGARGDSQGSEGIAMATIDWSHVADLIQPMGLLMQTCLTDIKDKYQFKKYDLQLQTACSNFIATFYNRWPSQPGYDAVKCVQQIEDLCHNLLLPCWKSFGFQIILQMLSEYSNIVNPPEKMKQEVCSCLPEYGSSSVEEDHFLPVVRTRTPFPLLTAILHLVFELQKINKGITEVVNVILSDTDMWTYIKKQASPRPCHLRSNVFTKFENILQYYYLKLAVIPTVQGVPDVNMLHSAALNLLTNLHHGDEHIAHDLLSTVIYNHTLWSHVTSAEEQIRTNMADMKLSSTTHLRSATQVEVYFTEDHLCMEACNKLNSIRATYLGVFQCSQIDVIKSRNRFLLNPTQVESFLTSNIGECLLPQDWMYMPLIELYNTIASIGAEAQNLVSASQVGRVSDTLAWIFLLERHRPVVMETVSITLKISRIMCTFLTGSDLFLEKSVYSYLAALLRQYTKPALLDKMNFAEHIPGLPSFYDMYVELLQQYEAVSFGDSLFGCYVLVPLQVQHNLELRKAVWTEHTGILRTLTIPVQELIIPIERYLEPEETCVELLRLYVQSLFSQTLRAKWSPVLYLMAVHHVNRFMFTQDRKHTQLKKMILKQVCADKNKEVHQHLLFYKCANTQNDFGLEFYTELPPLRQKLIDSCTS